MPAQNITVSATFKNPQTNNFSISGTISGDIISGVTVYADATNSAVTNADGKFTITNLNNGIYQITPTADGYTFSPENQSVTINNANVENINFTSTTSTNHLPVATDDFYNMYTDKVLTVTMNNGLLANDFDQDNDILTVSLSQSPSSGVLALNNDGSFSYTPEKLFSGQVSFSYTANDGNSESNTAVVTINIIKDENQALAVNDFYGASQDSELTISKEEGVMKNDLNTAPSNTVSITVKCKHGTVELTPDGSFSYNPEKDFSGLDSFIYKIDGITPETTASVTLTVKPVNITKGMIFALKKSKLPDTISFITPPKFYGITSKKQKGTLKKLPPTNDSYKGVWNKTIRLYNKKSLKAKGYVLETPLPSEKISLYLKGKTADKNSIDQKVKTVFLIPPEITVIGTKEGISENTFKAGSNIYITGKYFGNKFPKISLSTQGILLKCKVDKSYLKYSDFKGKPSIMDPETGDSAIRIIIPANSKITKGDFSLILDNKIGIATDSNGTTPVITIE
jgi:hypothetical protein